MLDFEECVRLRTMLERLRSKGYLKEPEYTLPNHETLPYVPRSSTTASGRVLVGDVLVWFPITSFFSDPPNTPPKVGQAVEVVLACSGS